MSVYRIEMKLITLKTKRSAILRYRASLKLTTASPSFYGKQGQKDSDRNKACHTQRKHYFDIFLAVLNKISKYVQSTGIKHRKRNYILNEQLTRRSQLTISKLMLKFVEKQPFYVLIINSCYANIHVLNPMVIP